MSKDKNPAGVAAAPAGGQKPAHANALSADEIIRLECVRIAFRPDHEPARITRTAAALEGYIASGKPAAPYEPSEG